MIGVDDSSLAEVTVTDPQRKIRTASMISTAGARERMPERREIVDIDVLVGPGFKALR
jgi:hypothetical protein